MIAKTIKRNTVQKHFVSLKNVGPFDGAGLTINFGQKKHPEKGNIHIVVGTNGSGKTTVLKDIFFQASNDQWNLNSENFFANHTFTGEAILPINFKRYLFYTPSEPMIKTNDYQYIPKNRDAGNNFISNWVVNYPEHEFLIRVKELADDKNKIDLFELGKLEMDNDLYQKRIKDLPLTQKIKEFIEFVYDIKFDYKDTISGYKPAINGVTFEFSQLSVGYRQIICLITDILIKVWNIESDLEKKENLEFVLLLDEIDVHLHPEAQRKILPAIQKLFPNAEIFCTTHSPFVVNSVDDAWVYEISEENYVNEKGGIWKSGDGMRFLNPVQTSIFKSFGNVLGVQFNTDEEFGIGAKEIFKELSELIKLKNVTPRMSEIVNQIRKEGSESIKSRLEFELSKNKIVI
jgi:predicted ATP-binding protein involved in virulence